MQVNGLQ